MKKIKSFKLYESLQDGQNILDALETTPEGRDLNAIVRKAKEKDFKDLIELKKTGRIYTRLFGSKTYIEKDGMYWKWVSLSNGVPFAQEQFGSIPELLRGLWKLFLKRNYPIGVKKAAIMNWIDNNPDLQGKELSRDDIFNIYKKEMGIPNTLSISEIFSSPKIKEL